MDLLNDIKDFLKDDDDHNLRIEVDYFGVTVYLDYDPGMDYEENCVIPVYYDTVESFCYIPHDKYCEMYKPNDFGMDLTEIRLIEKIMSYLENHKQEIEELCEGYTVEDRHTYKEKHNN